LFVWRNVLHEVSQLRESDCSLSVTLQFSGCFPRGCSWPVVDFLDPSITLKLNHEEVLGRCSESDAPSLGCFDLHETTIRAGRIVTSGAARQEGERVVVAGQDLA
jgi:hypothetical protein